MPPNISSFKTPASAPVILRGICFALDPVIPGNVQGGGGFLFLIYLFAGRDFHIFYFYQETGVYFALHTVASVF